MLGDIPKLHNDSCFVGEISVVRGRFLGRTFPIVEIAGLGLELVEEVDLAVLWQCSFKFFW